MGEANLELRFSNCGGSRFMGRERALILSPFVAPKPRRRRRWPHNLNPGSIFPYSTPLPIFFFQEAEGRVAREKSEIGAHTPNHHAAPTMISLQQRVQAGWTVLQKETEELRLRSYFFLLSLSLFSRPARAKRKRGPKGGNLKISSLFRPSDTSYTLHPLLTYFFLPISLVGAKSGTRKTLFLPCVPQY